MGSRGDWTTPSPLPPSRPGFTRPVKGPTSQRRRPRRLTGRDTTRTDGDPRTTPGPTSDHVVHRRTPRSSEEPPGGGGGRPRVRSVRIPHPVRDPTPVCGRDGRVSTTPGGDGHGLRPCTWGCTPMSGHPFFRRSPLLLIHGARVDESSSLGSLPFLPPPPPFLLLSSKSSVSVYRPRPGL